MDEEKAVFVPRASAPAAELCRAFEDLARCLAPIELAEVPFYALPLSSLPSELHGVLGHCDGMYSRSFSESLKPYVTGHRGAGPTVLVRDVVDPQHVHLVAAEVQTIYAARGETRSIEELSAYIEAPSADRIAGILTHELGHALVDVANGGFESFESMFEGAERFKKRYAAEQLHDAVVAGSQEGPRPPQLLAHGFEFTRVVCHLDWRLRRLGFDLSAHLDCAGEKYEMAVYSDCYEALGAEMRDCRNKSFKEILGRPLPDEFRRCDRTPRPA